MAYTQVLLHNLFSKGCSSSDNSTDLQAMTSEEKSALLSWITKILLGAKHVGYNKPSYQNKDQHDNIFDIADSGRYKRANLWHYHCGNPYKTNLYAMTEADLEWNELGQQSAAVYHYTKSGKSTSLDTITVVGFGRNHIPFLSALAHKNPLTLRIGTPNNTSSATPVLSPPQAAKENEEK